MKNILWLASWYPNRFDKSRGNFIQRHAKAASLYANIHVLYIHAVEERMDKAIEEVLIRDGNLTEQIIYYNSSPTFFKKFNLLRKYYALSKKYVRQYVSDNGVPAYVHVHVPVRAGNTALWMKKIYNVNYALTEQYDIYNSYSPEPFEKRNFFFRSTVKNIIKNARPFICVSQQMAREINANGIKRDYTIIPNVVNTRFFNFAEKKEENTRFRFLHVSNMTRVKNVDGIIEAAKLLSAQRNDFELQLVGKYPEKIFKQVEQTGLLNKHIFFRGQMPYTQVAEEMQRADTFVLFSNSESGSCILEEALCCGLPVIATPVGNNERVNETNGILVKMNDSQSLADGMGTMIDRRGRFNRRQISATFVKQLNYETIGKQIVDCYRA